MLDGIVSPRRQRNRDLRVGSGLSLLHFGSFKGTFISLLIAFEASEP